ncbi:Carbamoyl-phosphate synthase [Sorochytrium milnesiophthora]
MTASFDIVHGAVTSVNSNEPNATVATLALKDGTCYQGFSFGAERSVAGECVFQTGMVGYPESFTDPSYRGQILVLTYPLVGNYGVPSREEVDKAINSLLVHFESNQIHIAALIVGQYSAHYSHFLAASSLSQWLKENNVPAIYGVDTRALTKKIRMGGVLLGKIVFPKASLQRAGVKTDDKVYDMPCDWIKDCQDTPWVDPNDRNLVAEVSTKNAVVYPPVGDKPVKGPDGKVLRIMAVDVGMKYNQIRCFVRRGVELKVVPWNYDFVADTDYDGLFVSNGPGDPTMVTDTIARLRKLLELKTKPVFGICLGHQLLALAAGAKTIKLKYGNRGHNIPCTDLHTGRCHITSQNHGYAVDTATLPEGWEELFVNANDGSNEGINHKTLPFFSVQFHPESTPGPRDTEFLFDKFIENVRICKEAGKLVDNPRPEPVCASKRVDVKKVLVLGSGGLSIGQAGEFDYSGSQAIKALKEEGIYTVLINPNIATIQTSKGLADKVYFLPVTPESVRKVIEHEKPDGIYVTFGGQTALNVGVKMKDEFEGLGVKVLGTPIETIILTEDRELFANALQEINEKCAASMPATTIEDAIYAANQIGYPLIIRAAYALGGLGSGFAENEEQLVELCRIAFAASPQVLVERSMKGWKEIEYEVVRDCNNNCITVCNMENFDPLGIHTGDSIVVAPSQTLSDEDYNMLRTTSVNVIRHLGVVGECNVQFALDPFSKNYCIIEVNARLSRSSALASKATGYPLAFVAAKLGLCIPLNEIKNSVTEVTSACFEPSLDYCVVKIPRWDLKKFNRVSKQISSAMKSVGEVMSIGRTFEETIQKAIRAVDAPFVGFADNDYVDDIDEELQRPTDLRLFAIAHAFHKGYTVDRIWELTRIDKWFLHKLQGIVELDKSLQPHNIHNVPAPSLLCAKQMGFSDAHIAQLLGSSEMAVRELRKEHNITPFVKQIDTVAAEFPAHTNYLYMTYNAVENDVDFTDKGIAVLGSGVYRIGSSVEFDWCAVSAVRTLRANGYKTVMINYNPETVSTDYNEADRLYFENISLERVLDIYELEHLEGLIISMGGQTPNNIALPLHRQNVKILGTSPEMIDTAENRYKFSRMLDKIGVDQPLWKELTSYEEAGAFCDKVGYPVLVRPSYVLSGAAMNVVFSPDDLASYLGQAVAVSRDYPVVISKFIEDAKEIEMDAVAKDGKLLVHIVSEHIENAGVHSGDATLVLPPQDLAPETVQKIEVATAKIAHALNVTGPFNIQFIAKNNEIKVIECNLRAARSSPFVSKVMDVNLVELATRAMLDLPVEPVEVHPPPNYVAVKVPQFSFSRLSGADPILGVEMASTGEVACFGSNKYEAYLKALLSTGFKLPRKNILLSIGSFKEKAEFLPSIKKLHQLGYNLFATSGTADYISEHGVPVQYLEVLDEKHNKQQKSEYSLQQHLSNNLIDLYINLPSRNRYRRPASYMSRGYKSRRMAVDFSIPLITNIKCAKVFVEALGLQTQFPISSVDYKTSHRTVTLPGLVNVSAFIPQLATDGSAAHEESTKVALAGGFTTTCITPVGASAGIVDRASLQHVQQAAKNAAYCDYTLGILATSGNVSQCPSLSDVVSLLVTFNSAVPSALKSTGDVLAHFAAWPVSGPLVTDAKGTELASMLFLANLHGRSIHVTDVSTADDVRLVAMSKQKGVRVTCDVSVYSLFFSRSVTKCDRSPTDIDIATLWEHMNVIDCFSIGATPFYAAQAHKVDAQASAGTFEALPLLLGAVAEGRLTTDDIVQRMHTAPRALFDLPEQEDTYIEVEIDRRYKVKEDSFPVKRCAWSPLLNKVVQGRVQRVVLRGQTVYLDGEWTAAAGRDVSPVARMAASVVSALPQLGTSAHTKDNASVGMSIKSPRMKTPRDFTAPTPSKLDMVPISEYLGTEVPQTPVRSRLDSLTTVAATPAAPSTYANVPVGKSPFYRQHIVSVKQFSRNELHILFGVASEMRNIVERQGSTNLLTGRVLCSAFYEPSTRTSCSFESAWTRLGGSVLSVNQITSSIAKGESFPDTVRTLAAYSDCLVVRHPEKGSIAAAAKVAKIPVINAGDGIGEHPTQAFLDVYTIREELGTVNGLTVTIVGDLKNGRTVHSLVKLLSQYDVKINYCSPPSLRIPENLFRDVAAHNIPQVEGTDLDQFIATTDVLYVTRVQKERFSDAAEYDKVKDLYMINANVLRKAKKHMVVMHPLPRISEIDPEVDYDPRAAYFRQMRYGLFVRMALLALVMGKLA